MPYTITISEDDVRQAMEEYGYEATEGRIADVMQTVASCRCLDVDEIVRQGVEVLAEEQGWQPAML